MITFWLVAGVVARAGEAPPVPVETPVNGGGVAWRGPKQPQYRVHPEYEAKPKKKRKTVTEPEVITLAPDLHVQTGIVETTPAWDAIGELDNLSAEAERLRKKKLRAIALADDEWLMVA